MKLDFDGREISSHNWWSLELRIDNELICNSLGEFSRDKFIFVSRQSSSSSSQRNVQGVDSDYNGVGFVGHSGDRFSAHDDEDVQSVVDSSYSASSLNSRYSSHGHDEAEDMQQRVVPGDLAGVQSSAYRSRGSEREDEDLQRTVSHSYRPVQGGSRVYSSSRDESNSESSRTVYGSDGSAQNRNANSVRPLNSCFDCFSFSRSIWTSHQSRSSSRHINRSCGASESHPHDWNNWQPARSLVKNFGTFFGIWNFQQQQNSVSFFNDLQSRLHPFQKHNFNWQSLINLRFRNLKNFWWCATARKAGELQLVLAFVVNVFNFISIAIQSRRKKFWKQPSSGGSSLCQLTFKRWIISSCFLWITKWITFLKQSISGAC